MENASCNDDPLTIVDIGASGGIHARWSGSPCGLRAVLFEPDPREFDTLTSMAPHTWTVINSALSDRSGDIEFRLARKQQVSSVYPPNNAFLEKFPDPDRFQTVKTITIRADTLDNQLKINGIQDVDFIKIDAEGYALPILKGGGESLPAVIGLELEVEFLPLRQGQPLFPDVHGFVQERGFELVDLRRYFWRRAGTGNYGNTVKGQFVFADALYLRTPERVLSMPGISEAKIFRAVVVYLSYGYFDLAEVLFRSAGAKGLLSSGTSAKIETLLNKRRNKPRLPDFRGKGRIHDLLARFADVFAVGGEGGAYSGTDPKVGNL